MKILIAIDAPGFGNKNKMPREQQWELTELNNVLKLIGTRIEMGTRDGAVNGTGVTAHFKIEQTPAPANEEAA